MNKKLMAVAVAGALAAPAALAQSNVTISGRMSLFADTYSATGATQNANSTINNYQGLTSRSRISDNGSRVSVAGTEDLGNGMKASFYIETGFMGDSGLMSGGNQNSATLVSASNVGGLGSRYAWVGLSGGFGEVRFGRQNVFWTNGNSDQAQSNLIQAGSPFTSAGTFGSGMGLQVSRQPNTLQYLSPNLGGFQAIVSWSPNRGEAVQPVTAAATQTSGEGSGRLWGLTAQWTGGPYQVGYDWVEDRGNPLATTTGSLMVGKGVGHKLRAAWKVTPNTNLGVVWSRAEISNGGATGGSAGGGLAATNLGTIAGVGTTLKQAGWLISAEHLQGNVRFIGQYSKVGNIKGCNSTETYTVNGVVNNACDNTGAKAYTLGVNYLLSKRTHIAASYSKILNDSNYFADFTTGANSSYASSTIAGTTGTASVSQMAGSDPKIISVGIIHNF